MKPNERNDPTPEQIWGPINPQTGLHMGGGLADLERANRRETSGGEVRSVQLLMLPFGRGKLLGSD